MARLRFAAPLLAAAVAAAAIAGPGAAVPRPQLVLAAGQSFGADGNPSGGGLSAAFSPLWPVADHARFGGTVFADDIGTDLGRLFDPHTGGDLGAVALRHRWAWGAAWRGEYDLHQAARWAAGASGTWGWYRFEDDQRGAVTGARSAVGLSLGTDVRRTVSPTQQLGVALRYHQLFQGRRAAPKQVRRYATAALEWRWSGPDRH
jgi:hypothetical protein